MEQIVSGLSKNLNAEDEIIFFFDHCTDKSYEKFMEIKDQLPSAPAVVTSNEDLFEVKANNQLLRLATRDIIVLFQDDIVLNDIDLKPKIINALSHISNPGLLGGRTGFELHSKEFPERPVNKVSNWEHLPQQYGEGLSLGGFAVRTYLNRGPLVFTRDLLNEVGYLDEDFYPLWGDDLEYCARSHFQYGRNNAVFECDVESKLNWGGMRKKDTPLYQRFGNTFIKENWNKFIQKWGDYVV